MEHGKRMSDWPCSLAARCETCRAELKPEDSFCSRCGQAVRGRGSFPVKGARYWSLDETSRFCLWNPGVVWDREQQLLWQRECRFGLISWQESRTFLEALNEDAFGGLSLWRLPTLAELASLLTPWMTPWGLFLDPIFSVPDQAWCWSADRGTSGRSYAVLFYPGTILSHEPGARAFLRAVCPVPEPREG